MTKNTILTPTTKITIKDVSFIMKVSETTAQRYMNDIRDHFKMQPRTTLLMQHLQIYYQLTDDIYKKAEQKIA